MGAWHEKPLGEKFEPDQGMMNAVKGMLVGAVEAPGDGHAWAVESDWIDENIPNAQTRTILMLEAGIVWVHDWSNGDVTLGLTEDALAWLVANMGFPADSVDDDEVSAEWIEKIITPTFQRRTSPSIRRATSIVKKTSYSISDAREAHDEIITLVQNGSMTEREGATYKAHVTRRLSRTTSDEGVQAAMTRRRSSP